MIRNSARLTAGHFFKQTLVLLVLLSLSCNKQGAREEQEAGLAISCEIPILIMVPDAGDFQPESVMDKVHTAFGRFYPSLEEQVNPFKDIAAAADSEGMLILAILSSGMEWHGEREHLVIWLDSLGKPVMVQPEMNSELLADSLWTDPLTRQNTIAELIEFTRPDLVMEQLTESSMIEEIVDFWSAKGQIESMTACLYCMPDLDATYRGWGIFTGSSVTTSSIQGMSLNDFQATFLLLAELDWIETGYPVVSTFLQTESE